MSLSNALYLEFTPTPTTPPTPQSDPLYPQSSISPRKVKPVRRPETILQRQPSAAVGFKAATPRILRSRSG